MTSGRKRIFTTSGWKEKDFPASRLGWRALAAVGLLMLGGAVVAIVSNPASVQANPALPQFSDLAASDPRRTRPLSYRRRVWLIWVATWLVGWLMALIAMHEAGPSSPALVKLALFLTGTIGPVLAGIGPVRTRNGSTHWPSQ